MRRRHLNSLKLLAPVVLVAAGCVTYEPQPLSTASVDARFAARTLDRADLRDFVQQHAPGLETNCPRRGAGDFAAARVAESDGGPARSPLESRRSIAG